MLLRLTIEGIGLIERAEVEFAAGFTAFTGETGSGKSMLLGALDVALGARVDRDLVRGDRARVTLELAAAEPLRALLAENGVALAADDDVVIVREVSAGGRAQARINGVAVSASQLRAVGALAVDAVGQGEAQRLVEPAFARELLDRFGGEATLALRARLRATSDERRRLLAERDDVRSTDGRALAMREEARFALAEIEGAGLGADDEDAHLRERREVLANAERIAEGLARARGALEDERGAVDALGDAAHALAALARFGAAYAEMGAAATALQGEANALAAALARAADDVERDPAALDAVGARLDALETLKRKYGGTLAAVRAAHARAAALVERDLGRDERLAALDAAVAAVDAALAADAAALSARRREAAARCVAGITAELRALAMPSAAFEIGFEPLAEIAAHGADRIEFRFAANPGEPLRPLARIASGGERSRALLAIVVVLGGGDEGRTFVFDEIDAGIGGAAAAAVGIRLGRLAAVAQVVCVTHLAQIGAWAHQHCALRKREDGARATIEVVELAPGEERLAEIARMLSGDVTPISLEHAATLIAATRSAR